MSALQTDLTTYHLTSLFYQGRIPGGSHTEACREDGGADGHVSMGGFFCQKKWDAQTRVLHDVFLESIASLGGQFRSQAVLQGFLCPGVCTIGAPEHTNVPLGDVFLEQFRGHDILSLNGIVIPGEGTAQLANLLFERHPSDEVVHAFLYRKLRILVR